MDNRTAINDILTDVFGLFTDEPYHFWSDDDDLEHVVSRDGYVNGVVVA